MKTFQEGNSLTFFQIFCLSQIFRILPGAKKNSEKKNWTKISPLLDEMKDEKKFL